MGKTAGFVFSIESFRGDIDVSEFVLVDDFDSVESTAEMVVDAVGVSGGISGLAIRADGDAVAAGGFPIAEFIVLSGEG